MNMRVISLSDVLGYRWQYDGPTFICGASPAAGGAGGAGGAGATEGSGGPPAAAAPAPAAPPAAPTVDWATAPAHFRTAYEKLKSDHEALEGTYKPLKELGEPADLQRGYEAANRIYTELSTLGTAQGYPQEQIDEAFDKDPVGTLAFLRAEAAKAGKGDGAPPKPEDIQRLIDQRVTDATKPLTEWHNEQLTTAANQRFESEYNKLFDADYKDAPPEFRQALYDVTSELIKYDQEALVALKTKGNTAAVAKYFAEGKKFMTQVYTAMNAMEQKRIAGGGGPRGPVPPGGPARKGPSLDDIISGKVVDDKGHIRVGA